MAMNWGGFAGGFAQGVNTGMTLGTMYKNAKKEDDINKIREQATAEATAARQQALTEAGGKVADMAPPAAPSDTGPAAGTVVADNAQVQTQAVPMAPSVATAAAGGLPGAPAAAAPTAPPAAPGAPAAGPVAMAPPGAPAVPSVPQVAAQGMPMAEPKRYQFGNQNFDTREQATAAAEKSVPSQRDFFMKVAVPQITQRLTEMGELEKADAWTKYAGEAQTQKNMESWAQMARAAQSGNYEAAADHAFELYKHYDDGVTPVSKELVKDKEGNVTGFNVKLKNDASGEERSQFIGTKEIVEMGLSALSPPAMFNAMYQRQGSADTLAAKARIDAQNDARTQARDVAKQTLIENRADKRQVAKATADAAQAERQHGYKLEELTTAEGLKQAGIGKSERAKVQAHIDLLSENGYSPEDVKGLLPAIMKVGEFKKATDPAERRAMIATELAKDPLFMRKSLDEKNKAVDDMMAVAGSGNTPRRAAPAAAPAVPAAAPQAGKTPVWDSKTQSIVYR